MEDAKPVANFLEEEIICVEDEVNWDMIDPNNEVEKNKSADTEKPTPFWWHTWVTVKKTEFCSHCGNVGPHLKQCGKCTSVSYCNKKCQTVHWKEGGHRKICKKPSHDLTVKLSNRVYAEIFTPPIKEDDLVGLQIQGKTNTVFPKRDTLVFVPDSETLRVCRMAARGEEGFYGGYYQDTRWPVAVLEAMPYTTAPVSTLLGIPLRLTHVKPRSKLTKLTDFDNQWATWLMIEPKSGFAPPEWQAYVGPVVVWRPDGAVSSHDMALLNDFLSIMLDHYSVGNVIPGRDLTPEAWAEWKIALIEKRGEGVMQYTDINI